MSSTITAATGPIILKEGETHHTPVSLQAHPNGGTITIEIYDPQTRAFYLPNEPLHSLTARTTIGMDRVGKPSVRITATGPNAYVVLHGVLWT